MDYLLGTPLVFGQGLWSNYVLGLVSRCFLQGCDFIKGSFFFHEIPMKFHEKQAFHEVSFHMPSVKNNDSTISFHFISRMATRPSFHFISFHGFVK